MHVRACVFGASLCVSDSFFFFSFLTQCCDAVSGRDLTSDSWGFARSKPFQIASVDHLEFIYSEPKMHLKEITNTEITLPSLERKIPLLHSCSGRHARSCGGSLWKRFTVFEKETQKNKSDWKGSYDSREACYDVGLEKQMERKTEELLETFLRGRLVDSRRTRHQGGTKGTSVEHLLGQVAATTGPRGFDGSRGGIVDLLSPLDLPE